MPQEFHVIRCFSCETFQVHIVKKSNKWSCKMCGENQSIKKVYFQGSGKDCRLNVQTLNEKRILNDLKENQNNQSVVCHNENLQLIEVNQKNKWEEFLINDKESSEDEVEDSHFTFTKPNKRKAFAKKTNHNKKLKLSSAELSDKEFIEDSSSSNDNFQEKNKSKWNSFIAKIENNSGTITNTLNVDQKLNDHNKYSKWNSFIDTETVNNDEIKTTLNVDSTSIFSSNDHNLDDILNI